MIALVKKQMQRSLFLAVFICFPFSAIAGPYNVPEVSLYFPHVASNGKWETEIALINMNSKQLAGTLIAYNSQGGKVSQKDLTFSGNGRWVNSVSSNFSNPQDISYVKFSTDSSNVCGYTKFYQEGLYRVAVPAVQEINTGDIYVPHIASNDKWWTGLALVNTRDSEKTLNINFSTGQAKQVVMSPGEHKSFNIKSLFGGTSQPDIESAEITGGSGVIGLELFSGATTLSGVLLKDETTDALYFPHVASNDKWWTGIAAYNPCSLNASLTVTPYTQSGTALDTLSVDIAAGGKYLGNAKGLSLPENTAWFKIDSSQPLNGFELFGTTNGKSLTGYSTVNINRQEGIFPKFDHQGWTGIAFVNTSDSVANIDLRIFDDAGYKVSEKSISLAGHEKLVDNPENLFSGSITAATYMKFNSDRDVVGFQLNGSKDGMMLDGLPGMAGQLHNEENNSHSIITVEGSISEDSVWQNEVIVENSVVVEPEITLTLEPGTKVKFKHYRGYKEPEKRLRIDVLGNIIAKGTPESPIYFTSDASNPQNGDWSMIHLENPQSSVFQYCIIEFGQQGINVWGGSPRISHCIFRWNNWEGIYFESYSTPIIEYTRIFENGYNGLAAEQFNTITIEDCEAWRNGTNGIHIDASTSLIQHSSVHGNLASGLSVDNNSSMKALGVAIYNNQDCGIGFGEGNNQVEVSNLKFDGNVGENICGEYTEIVSSIFPPEQILFDFKPDQSYALGYIPGDPELDQYLYVYPDDETRSIVNKIGNGLGLTWSVAWDGQYIWTATLWGTVYKLDPQNGNIIGEFTTSLSQPWGMTYDGEYLWIVDFSEKRFVKINPDTGNELNSYSTPDSEGGCKGIAWDGSYLNIMGWTSPTVYQMDRKGNLVNTISLEEGGGGIAWDGTYFWVPGGGTILRYEGNGQAAGWIYAASEGTWGLTWDGLHLWATQRTNENWQDSKIFQLEIGEIKKS